MCVPFVGPAHLDVLLLLGHPSQKSCYQGSGVLLGVWVLLDSSDVCMQAMALYRTT
jgi:hypothetical protein